MCFTDATTLHEGSVGASTESGSRLRFWGRERSEYEDGKCLGMYCLFGKITCGGTCSLRSVPAQTDRELNFSQSLFPSLPTELRTGHPLSYNSRDRSSSANPPLIPTGCAKKWANESRGRTRRVETHPPSAPMRRLAPRLRLARSSAPASSSSVQLTLLRKTVLPPPPHALCSSFFRARGFVLLV